MKPQTGLDHSVERKYTANALPQGRAFSIQNQEDNYSQDTLYHLPHHLKSSSITRHAASRLK